MKYLKRALLLHLNTSFWSFAPVFLVVLTPTTGWGWFAKAIAVIWIFGVHNALVRVELGSTPYLSGTVGGYLIAMPFLALALWLDSGLLKTFCSFIFGFINLSCLFLIRNAIATNRD